MHAIYELKDMLCKELEEYGEKGELTTGSLDVIDKLAHTIKNLDKILEANDDEYSGHYMPWAYDDGMGRSMNRGSYRESYARKRGSDGRYASRGYSRGNLTAKLRELMNDAPDDRTRSEIQRLVEKMDDYGA